MLLFFFFQDLTKDITGVEKLLVQFKAIYNQFLLSGHDFEETVLKKFVADLVMDEDVLVPGGASSHYGQVLYQMLTAVDPKKVRHLMDGYLNEINAQFTSHHQRDGNIPRAGVGAEM